MELPRAELIGTNIQPTGMIFAYRHNHANGDIAPVRIRSDGVRVAVETDPLHAPRDFLNDSGRTSPRSFVPGG